MLDRNYVRDNRDHLNSIESLAPTSEPMLAEMPVEAFGDRI